MSAREYTKPEVQVIAFDIDDVRMELLLSKKKLEGKTILKSDIFASDLFVNFWDDGE